MKERSAEYTEISIILPARNEASNLEKLLPRLVECMTDAEIIVVDDGSTDHTAMVCQQWPVQYIRHPQGLGNGAAIKSGARAARGRYLVMMDADGQHQPEEIARLLTGFASGHDMVVGARSSLDQANWGRLLANRIFNRFASWMSGQTILDLTSGFRIMRADQFRRFLPLLPNGFSYPATITMAFLRSGFSVAYMPVEVLKRSEGQKSHIHPLKDGIRFLLIIMRIGTLYSPLKIFAPLSASSLLIGLAYYAYTYLTDGRFTNMGLLLLSGAILLLSIGLLSEQITTLVYIVLDREKDDPE